MAKLIILGSSNAIADESHENTHMVLQGVERTILIDCVNNAILRLGRVGLDHHDLTDLILTHFHPDHVSGVPLLLMNMWLLGRRRPLDVFGLNHTLDRVEDMMEFYDWSTWPNFFPLTYHHLPENDLTPVLESAEFGIYASPVCHLLPTIGLRFEVLQSGKTLAYSCDTKPCKQVVKLAAGVDLLIHEASGAFPGHTSAAQAGEIAFKAGARALCLIHYPTGTNNSQSLVSQAKKHFHGDVFLAKDFMEIEL
jgi:ribonuclease Z